MTQAAVWVTGADGFAGRWLLSQLRERGRPAAALVMDLDLAGDLGVPTARLDLAEAALAPPGARVLEAELPPPAGLIHLAAISHPEDCEARPELARAVNVAGPARLYEQLLGEYPELPVIHISSAYVYRPQNEPLREEQVAEPVNVYGSTKLQGEAVAMGLRDRGARVTVVRPFNHAGPGQAPVFALPSFALRLAALDREGGGTLEVGNLDRWRDFLHVRQVAETYLQLLDHAGETDVVNVCSGEGQRIGDLLDGLVSRLDAPITVKAAEARQRGSGDPNRIVGDPGRLRSLLGEAPVLDRGGLLDDLIADARTRLAAGEDLARA